MQHAFRVNNRVQSYGPLKYRLLTTALFTLDQVRDLFRLSYRSYCLDEAPDRVFRRVAVTTRSHYDAGRYAAAICESLGLVDYWVDVDIQQLERRRDILHAFRVVCWFMNEDPKIVDRAARAARKFEHEGGVIDDYAEFIDWAWGRIVNGEAI